MYVRQCPWKGASLSVRSAFEAIKIQRSRSLHKAVGQNHCEWTNGWPKGLIFTLEFTLFSKAYAIYYNQHCEFHLQLIISTNDWPSGIGSHAGRGHTGDLIRYINANGLIIMHLIKRGNVLKIGGFCFTPNLATAVTIFFGCWGCRSIEMLGKIVI